MRLHLQAWCLAAATVGTAAAEGDAFPGLFPINSSSDVGPSVMEAFASKPKKTIKCTVEDDGQTVVCKGRRFQLSSEEHESFTQEIEDDEPTFTIFSLGVLGCICMAALAAGLTMGLVSLDAFDIDVKLATSLEDCRDEQEREELQEEQFYAKKIRPILHGSFFQSMPLLKRAGVPKQMDPSCHHVLLVTLLLLNSAANETLPLFLDRLMDTHWAALSSVVLVLIFGEILPSAVFTGPQQLRIAARFAPLVRFSQTLFMPIVWPISLFLDFLLSEESKSRYTRGSLKALVKLQGSDACESLGLSHDEVQMVHGALELCTRTVEQVMTPLEKTEMVPRSTNLDEGTLAAFSNGHSRILVYEGDRHNVRGMLLTKRLLPMNPEDRRPLSSIVLKRPVIVRPGDHLLDVLNVFQKGQSHLAVVSSYPEIIEQAWSDQAGVPPWAAPLGVITLEDVIEELIKEEVFDEKDVSVKAHLSRNSMTARRVRELRKLAVGMNQDTGRGSSKDWVKKAAEHSTILLNSVLTGGLLQWLGSSSMSKEAPVDTPNLDWSPTPLKEPLISGDSTMSSGRSTIMSNESITASEWSSMSAAGNSEEP